MPSWGSMGGPSPANYRTIQDETTERSHANHAHRLWLQSYVSLSHLSFDGHHSNNSRARMYKARINKWRIGRNIKDTELRSMLWALTERKARGKATEFRLRDRTITAADLERSLRAKNSSLEQALQLERARSPITLPKDIGCQTLQPPRLLRHSDDYEMIEKTLLIIGNCIFGSLEKGAFMNNVTYLTGMKGCRHAVSALTSYMSQIISLWKVKDFEGSSWTLAAASAEIANVVSEEPPYGFGALAYMYFNPKAPPEITKCLLQYTLNLSAIKYGPSHPLCYLCASILEVGQANSRKLLEFCVRKCFETWQRILDPNQPLLLAFKVELLKDLVEFGFEDPAKAVKEALNIKQDLAKQTRPVGLALRLDLDLVRLLRQAGYTHSSLRLSHSILSRIESFDLDQTFQHEFQYKFHENLYLGWQKLQDSGQEEYYLREIIKVGTEFWGLQYPGVAGYLVQLLALLQKLGKHDDAEEVRGQIHKTRALAGSPFV